jgi:hypothetical protein
MAFTEISPRNFEQIEVGKAGLPPLKVINIQLRSRHE